MMYVAPFLALLLAGAVAAYHRVSLKSWVVLSVFALVMAALFKASLVATVIAGVLFAAVAVPLLHEAGAEVEVIGRKRPAATPVTGVQGIIEDALRSAGLMK